MRFLTALLRLLPPETAHAVALRSLAALAILPGGPSILRLLVAPPRPDPRTVGSLQFPHPVGLAAGYDKDALAVVGLGILGFSHLELGTVTPLPQPGNPRPRVFRAPFALLNRMGFPSRGAIFVAERLLHYRRSHPLGSVPLIGVNLGKNKETSLEDAGNDYAAVALRLAPLADYLCINVSSPNTPQLRALQSPERLAALVTQVRSAAESAAHRPVPVWVKLAPDLENAAIQQLAAAVAAAGAEALILGNTTISRPENIPASWKTEAGGVSGAPLTALARNVAANRLPLPLVACGGILEGAEAATRVRSGAVLVQLWTGLVFRGPGLIREVADAVRKEGV